MKGRPAKAEVSGRHYSYPVLDCLKVLAHENGDFTLLEGPTGRPAKAESSNDWIGNWVQRGRQGGAEIFEFLTHVIALLSSVKSRPAKAEVSGD